MLFNESVTSDARSGLDCIVMMIFVEVDFNGMMFDVLVKSNAIWGPEHIMV